MPVCVQITDLLAELADERSTSESASQLLETETSERLRLEKEMKDLQAREKPHINMRGVVTKYFPELRRASDRLPLHSRAFAGEV